MSRIRIYSANKFYMKLLKFLMKNNVTYICLWSVIINSVWGFRYIYMCVCLYVYLYIFSILFIHSSVNAYLGCLHILATVK